MKKTLFDGCGCSGECKCSGGDCSSGNCGGGQSDSDQEQQGGE